MSRGREKEKRRDSKTDWKEEEISEKRLCLLYGLGVLLQVTLLS